MIGFNEKQEAVNLLRLLKESRELLERFNMEDAQIAVAAGAAPENGAALEEALLDWYLPMALWEEQRRLSGRYALCFQSEKKVQTPPYNLLARLPLTEDETIRANVPAALFDGLNDEEEDRMRRLYYRLLCIGPLRTLLERLYTLARVAASQTGGEAEQRARLLACIRRPAWRRLIPMTEERHKGSGLNLNDNEFTIIDRLMDACGRSLTERVAVAIPETLVKRKPDAAALITTAAACSADDAQNHRSNQYRALPGGHTALGVYGDGMPEKLFEDAVRSQQGRRKDRLFRVRPYSRFQLVQVPEEISRALAVRVDWQPPAVPEEPKPLERRGWKECCSLIHNTVQETQRASQQTDADGQLVLCLPDDGASAYHALQGELQRRSDEARELRSARKNVSKSDYLLSEQLFAYLAGDEALSETQRQLAMANLQQTIEGIFARGCVPPKLSAEPLRRIRNRSKSWELQVFKLLMGYLSDESLLSLPCRLKEVPEAVQTLLNRLQGDAAACAEFRRFVLSKELARTSPYVYARYEKAEEGSYRLLVCKMPKEEEKSLLAWLQEEGRDVPQFKCEDFRGSCLNGVRRHLYRKWNVGTETDAAFRLASGKGMTQPADKCFQLACIYALSEMGGKTAEAILKKDHVRPGNSTLVIADQSCTIEAICKELSNKTPEAWQKLAGVARQSRLVIEVGKETDVVRLFPVEER